MDIGYVSKGGRFYWEGRIPTEFCHPGEPKKFMDWECHGHVLSCRQSLRQAVGDRLDKTKAERSKRLSVP